MHEASLVQNMIRVISRVRKNQTGTIRKINIAVGSLSGAIPSALVCAFDLLKTDTVCEKAQLHIQTVPLRILCLHCGKEYETEDYSPECPFCHGQVLRVIDGEDISVISLEVSDAD